MYSRKDLRSECRSEREELKQVDREQTDQHGITHAVAATANSRPVPFCNAAPQPSMNEPTFETFLQDDVKIGAHPLSFFDKKATTSGKPTQQNPTSTSTATRSQTPEDITAKTSAGEDANNVKNVPEVVTFEAEV